MVTERTTCVEAFCLGCKWNISWTPTGDHKTFSTAAERAAERHCEQTGHKVTINKFIALEPKETTCKLK